MPKFTCWGELEQGCFRTHKTIEEAAFCAVNAARTVVLEIDGNELNRFWVATAWSLPIVIRQAAEFSFSDSEKDYLIDFGLL